jgi:hypothetical protein
MKSWVAQGRVKPTDFVWSEGMPNWVAADVALGQAPTNPAGSTNPGDTAPPIVQQGAVNPVAGPPMYMGLPPLGNAPGAVSSMVCGIVGTVLSLPCCGLLSFITALAGLPLGIVALVQAKKAKALLAANPDMYGGQGMVTAGYILGIVAIALACLCLIGCLIYAVFVGTALMPMFRNGKF